MEKKGLKVNIGKTEVMGTVEGSGVHEEGIFHVLGVERWRVLTFDAVY